MQLFTYCMHDYLKVRLNQSIIILNLYAGKQNNSIENHC